MSYILILQYYKFSCWGRGARATGGWGLSGGLLNRRRALVLSVRSSPFRGRSGIFATRPSRQKQAPGTLQGDLKTQGIPPDALILSTDGACYVLSSFFVGGVITSIRVGYPLRLFFYLRQKL